MKTKFNAEGKIVQLQEVGEISLKERADDIIKSCQGGPGFDYKSEAELRMAALQIEALENLAETIAAAANLKA